MGTAVLVVCGSHGLLSPGKKLQALREALDPPNVSCLIYIFGIKRSFFRTFSIHPLKGKALPWQVETIPTWLHLFKNLYALFLTIKEMLAHCKRYEKYRKYLRREQKSHRCTTPVNILLLFFFQYFFLILIVLYLYRMYYFMNFLHLKWYRCGSWPFRECLEFLSLSHVVLRVGVMVLVQCSASWREMGGGIGIDFSD